MTRFWAEVRENACGFSALHRMELRDDWPSVRIEATVTALDRIRAYALEHEKRLASYEARAATLSYARRWSGRGRVLDFDFVAHSREA